MKTLDNTQGRVRTLLRKVISGTGVALVLFGIWTLEHAHSRVGVCTPIKGAGAGATTGIDSLCVKTLLSYTEGFVFVASGVIIFIIAFTMIARCQRFDLHSELHAVPRTWSKVKYVITSDLEEQPIAKAPSPVLIPHLR